MAPHDDLTAERAASGKSKRLAAHELLREIVGIIPMQPEQRCRRIDLLLDYAKTARQAALRECLEIARADGNIIAVREQLYRLASEGAVDASQAK